MVQGILFAVLGYSLLLTCVCVYKDNSSYFSIDNVDVIVAGPIMWILLLLLCIFRPILKRMHERRKNKPYIKKSQRHIEKVVHRVMKLYKSKYVEDDLFDFTRMISSEYGDILGWEDLLRKRPRYERLNRQFTRLMLYQEKDVLPILCAYFDTLSDEEKRQNWNLDEKTTYYRMKVK